MAGGTFFVGEVGLAGIAGLMGDGKLPSILLLLLFCTDTIGVLVCSGPVGLDKSDSFNRGGGRVRGEGLAGVWFLGFGIMGGGGCLGRGGGACFFYDSQSYVVVLHG